MADLDFSFLENLDEETITLLALWIRRRRKRRKSVRLMWVHPVLQKRKLFGEYHRLIRELALDSIRFREYFRVSPMQFEYLTSKIGSLVAKQTTKYREAISVGERLAICLR